MRKTRDLIALEYSVAQRTFHVHDLEDALKANMRAVSDDRPVDFVMIGVFDSREECDIFLERAKKFMADVRRRNAEIAQTLTTLQLLKSSINILN